jgi:Leucine-rich repeat (LRR) protein
MSFTALKQLDISNNSLVALPEGILALGELRELNVAGNKLKELPKVTHARHLQSGPCCDTYSRRTPRREALL